MKNECEIVQDLLFSYNDGILSASSKELVEEHLKGCNKCKKVLEEIQKDSKEVVNKKEIDYLKKIKKKMKTKSIWIIVISIILAILLIFNILVYNTYRKYAKKMEILLDNDITEEQLYNIEEYIKSKYPNIKMEYYSEEDALEKIKESFGDKAYLLDGYNEKNIFPASYYIEADVYVIKDLEDTIKDMPGVEKVTSNYKVNPYAVYYYTIKNKI